MTYKLEPIIRECLQKDDEGLGYRVQPKRNADCPHSYVNEALVRKR